LLPRKIGADALLRLRLIHRLSREPVHRYSPFTVQLWAIGTSTPTPAAQLNCHSNRDSSTLDQVESGPDCIGPGRAAVEQPVAGCAADACTYRAGRQHGLATSNRAKRWRGEIVDAVGGEARQILEARKIASASSQHYAVVQLEIRPARPRDRQSLFFCAVE